MAKAVANKLEWNTLSPSAQCSLIVRMVNHKHPELVSSSFKDAVNKIVSKSAMSLSDWATIHKFVAMHHRLVLPTHCVLPTWDELQTNVKFSHSKVDAPVEVVRVSSTYRVNINDNNYFEAVTNFKGVFETSFGGERQYLIQPQYVHAFTTQFALSPDFETRRLDAEQMRICLMAPGITALTESYEIVVKSKPGNLDFESVLRQHGFVFDKWTYTYRQFFTPETYRMLLSLVKPPLMNYLDCDKYLRTPDMRVQKLLDEEKIRELMWTKLCEQRQHHLSEMRKLNNMTFRQHQLNTIQFGLVQRSWINALDMGLGKTLVTWAFIMTSLQAAKELKYENFKVIIVCPAKVISVWQGLIGNDLDLAQQIRVYSWAQVPTYETLRDELDCSNYMVVLDEAHYAQDLKSQRTRAVRCLTARSLSNMLLSGTPNKNGRADNIYPLLAMCRHRTTTHGYKHFMAKYDTQLDALGQEIKDIVIYYHKRDCLDLPPKQYIDDVTPFTAAQKNAYTEACKEWLAQSPAFGSPMQALVNMTGLLTHNSVDKIPGTIELVQDLLDSGEAVVCFTKFREAWDAIYAHFTNLGVGVVGINGTTPSKDVTNIVNQFQTNDKVRLFVGSIKSCGEGLTLHKSSTIVLHDREWTPASNNQAEDRVNRIGQENQVIVYNRIGHPVDTYLSDVLKDKDLNIEDLMKYSQYV